MWIAPLSWYGAHTRIQELLGLELSHVSNKIFSTRCRTYYNVLHGEKKWTRGKTLMNFCLAVRDFLWVWGQLSSFQNWVFSCGKDQTEDLSLTMCGFYYSSLLFFSLALLIPRLQCHTTYYLQFSPKLSYCWTQWIICLVPGEADDFSVVVSLIWGIQLVNTYLYRLGPNFLGFSTKVF